MTEYATEQLPRLDEAAVLTLADHMARQLFGVGMTNHPDGRLALAVASRKVMLEYAAAALTCPGFTYTGGES